MRQRDRPSVRLSPGLQAVVERAGDSGAAIRALIILGAAATGEDLSLLADDIGALRWNRLSPDIKAALERLSDMRLTTVRHFPELVPAAEEAAIDPFAGIGIAV